MSKNRILIPPPDWPLQKLKVPDEKKPGKERMETKEELVKHIKDWIVVDSELKEIQRRAKLLRTNKKQLLACSKSRNENKTDDRCPTLIFNIFGKSRFNLASQKHLPHNICVDGFLYPHLGRPGKSTSLPPSFFPHCVKKCQNVIWP